MDPRGTPVWVVPAHDPNQIPNLLWHRRPARLPVANLPPPEETKALPVPRDDRLGFDHDQSGFPVRPHAPPPDPEDSIGGRQLQPFRSRTPQHGQLLPQSPVLPPERSGGLAQRGEAAQDGEPTSPHRGEEQREFEQPQ